MGEQIEIDVLGKKIGVLLVEMMPNICTVEQLRGLQVEIVCAASDFCAKNDIANNIYATTVGA